MSGRGAVAAAYVCGTFDTKAVELNYLADLLRAVGLRTVTVDLGTMRQSEGVDVPAREVAEAHPDGADAVLAGDDRGTAVSGMSVAFERWLAARDDVGGVIGAGGSAGHLASLSCSAARLTQRRPRQKSDGPQRPCAH